MAIREEEIQHSSAYLLGYSEGTLRHILEICSRPVSTKKDMAENLVEIAILARASLNKSTGRTQ